MYEGSWAWGKFHGKGTYNYANGDKYQGAWVEGKRQGFGEYLHLDVAGRLQHTVFFMVFQVIFVVAGRTICFRINFYRKKFISRRFLVGRKIFKESSNWLGHVYFSQW